MDTTTIPDPFSKEGAARIAQITGQKLATTPIDASLIGSTPSIAIPPTPTPPSHDLSSIVLPPIQNTPEQDTLTAEKDTLVGDINADTTKLGTKSARQNELEAAQGIPQLNKDIQELYDQANQLDVAAVQAKANSEDRLAPTFAITGEQAAIDRQAAAKKAGIAALASAKQGKLALAQDYVTKALAAEFDPIAAEIEHKKFLLTINMDSFNTEEKRRAEAQQEALDQQKQQLQDTKDAKSKIYDIMLAAAQNGADNLTLSKIQNATTPDEAITLADSVLGAKFQSDKTQQNFDNNIKLAQLAIDQAKLRNDASTVSDPSQILAYAQQYASDGKIPTGLPKGTFGIISQVAKELPKPEGTLVSNTTGISPSNLSATQTDGITALYDLQSKLDQAKGLFDQMHTGMIAGVKNAIVPSQTVQQYNDLRLEISDLLARARTGAAINTNEERIYNAKLPGTFNKSLFLGGSGAQKIDDLKSSLSGKLNSSLKINNTAIYGYSTVTVGGQPYTVGQIVTNDKGQQGRVNPDGSITLIQ